MGIAKAVPALPGRPDTLSGILPPVLLRATGGSVQSTYLEENLVRPMCLAKPQLSVWASGRPHCRDHAAVDQQVTAGDEGSVWTHQIGGGGDLSGAAPPRGGGLDHLVVLRSGRRVQRAVNLPC
jgi:hypothetical protein